MANTRRNTAIAASIFYLLSVPFLILVCIGNTYENNILNDIYFFKLDVSQVIPISVANSNLLNSVARSLGLHDFYQVGIWSFCEGYNDEGVTYCSPPKSFYWFNPVQVLVSELLSGAQIALPSEVTTILTVLRIGSQIMHGFFLAGAVLNFVLVIASPLVILTRWWSLALALLGAVASIIVTVGAVIATVISFAAKIALTAQDQLNIRAEIGVKMFAFMWIAAICTDLAFLLHAAMGCCCKPDRRKAGLDSGNTSPSEKRQRIELPSFVRRRRGQAMSA